MRATEVGWTRVASAAELEQRGRLVVRVGGKQLLVIRAGDRIYACNNRCPHEGYPLVEGSLSAACTLTCNWHNWKFDLADGRTLVGGDALRVFPVRIDADDVLVDLGDPPAEVQTRQALDALHASFERFDYPRMGREIARLIRADGDPLDAMREAVVSTHDRFEYGATHAQAVATDWLRLRDTVAQTDAERLVPILEAVAHLAWDSLRQPRFPFADGCAPFANEAFLAAVEAEDEDTAVAQVRGALAGGIEPAALERAFAAAALEHYADFGHALIYVYKTFELIERLGHGVAEPLLLSLTRSLVYATREDLIPEFRWYRTSLDGWMVDRDPRAMLGYQDYRGLSIHQALDRTAGSTAPVEAVWAALYGAAAWNLLHFDVTLERRTTNRITDNVGWLDLTHPLTFGNAVATLCRRYPELWPAGLLQMACFVGRSSAYGDAGLDTRPWRVDAPEAFFDATFRGFLDHAQQEFIVACHLVKTATAVEEEFRRQPGADWQPLLLAGLNRFLGTPLKRKHALRVAEQSLQFVLSE